MAAFTDTIFSVEIKLITLF